MVLVPAKMTLWHWRSKKARYCCVSVAADSACSVLGQLDCRVMVEAVDAAASGLRTVEAYSRWKSRLGQRLSHSAKENTSLSACLHTDLQGSESFAAEEDTKIAALDETAASRRKKRMTSERVGASDAKTRLQQK